MSNTIDRWPHEVKLDTPITERVIIRRSENKEKIEHNIPHTLSHRSAYGFNCGTLGERGQFDASLNIAHHLVRMHGMQRALSTEVVRTQCGRRTWKTALILSDYIRWYYVSQDGGMDEKTEDVLQFMRDVIARIKRANDRRLEEQQAAAKKGKGRGGKRKVAA